MFLKVAHCDYCAVLLVLGSADVVASHYSMPLAINNLGTELAEPFGKDIVDLPLETYCRTVEVQILEANNRSVRFGFDFARES